MFQYKDAIAILASKFNVKGLYSEEFLRAVAELQKNFPVTTQKIRFDVREVIEVKKDKNHERTFN